MLILLTTAVVVGLAINQADRVLEDGMTILRIARTEGAMEGINRYLRSSFHEEELARAEERGYEEGLRDGLRR